MAYNKYSIDLASYFAKKELDEAAPEAPGIMKRSRSKQEAQAKEEAKYSPYGFMPKFTSYLAASYANEDEARAAMGAVESKDSRGAQQDEINTFLSQMAKQSALEETTRKLVGGVVEGATKQPVEQEGDHPAAAFTKGFLSTLVDTKEEEQPATTEAESTKEASPKGAGLMSRPVVSSSGEPATMKILEDTVDIPEAIDIVTNRIGMTEDQWKNYREAIADIESKGRYNIKGGANDHYDGRYQMGKAAKEDAAALLGFDIGHKAADREAFRSDPALQEKAFAAFTAQNHRYLMRKSTIYPELSLKEKLGVLGYAHNQGWSAAADWLETGNVGSDAFGTKGTRYYDAVTSLLAG